jgi:YD repeat-containing protein
MQLREDPQISPDLLVLTKDGTQFRYHQYGTSGDYYCTQIKDRNGNYISATYSSSGRITKVTDTLGREINFNYDIYQNLSSITQNWWRNSPTGLVNETHTWASFGWDNLTIQTGFYGLTLSGVQNGQSIPVLKQVGLPDGSYYRFEYTSWGQVSAIKNYEVTNSLFGSVSYNMNTGAWQTDCPRFTERRDYVRDWNNNAEAVTYFSTFDPSNGFADMTMPDGTLYREYFYNSGWAQGLTYQSEIWSAGVRRKWTTVAWTQDNTSLNYQLNPRPYDISIYDEAGNRKRTYIDYGTTYWQYGLPYGIWEYHAGGTSPYRVTFYDYNLSQAYLDKHIIGLVSEIHVSDTQAYVAKTRYEYDAGGTYLQATSTNATQHDPAYGTGWTARGNVTSVSRYDVSDITNASKRLTTSIGYDTDGSPIFTRDHLGHQSSVSYADSFSDSVNRNTFAYPTTITDADNYSSTVQYNYSMGVASRTQDAKGMVKTFAFDSVGRQERVTNQTSGAYQRWVYTNSTLVQQFTTIQSGAAEAYTYSVYDAAGRMRATGSDHPNSTGGYATTMYVYDVMGRLSQQSNPTEMTGGWIPSGDDAAGWVWSSQQYDWNGRPTVTTNADGTTTQASYSGCGCAGGEVVTLTGEALAQGNRRQKIYKDVLGRVVKTEALNWDSSVYSAVVTSYNTRDQVTNVRQYAGAEGSGTYQDTVMTYDYYGRLLTSKAPSQLNPTTYTYNDDGTVNTVTDARQVTQTFSYNARHLVTGISYSAPSGITPTSSVSYSYDAAGNRTGMTDGAGSTSYQYNTLSQLTQETRTFTGLGSFNIYYSYNLAGQLTSITDPFSSAISYGYDQLGRVSGVTGTSFGGVTQYAGNIQYRAWGALKHLSYGNNPRSLDITYNSRLQVNRFTIAGVMDKQYQYFGDGRLKFTQDLMTSNSKFDRSYSYDHLGRITQALSGLEARGGQSVDGKDRPYNETFSYDSMNHLTNRTTLYWDHDYSSSDSYVNDRGVGWSYDASGRILGNPYASYLYDAAGQMISVGVDNSTTQSFDGDGQRVKTVEETFNEYTWQYQYETKYYIRSSMLGGRVITEMNAAGNKLRTYVYAGDGVLAWQEQMGSTQTVTWEMRDASNATLRTTDSGGNLVESRELEPLGANAGLSRPFVWNPPDKESLLPYPAKYDPTSTGVTYNLDGVPVSADQAMQLLHNGGAFLCPENNCGPRLINGRLEPLTTDPNTGRLAYGQWERVDITTVDEDGRRETSRGTPHFKLSQTVDAYPFGSLPQRSGFLIGRFGFSQAERERLDKAFERVNSQKCHKFFDETIANMRKRGEIAPQSRITPSTLQGVLNITTLNKYSPDLTARQVGVGRKSWAEVQDKFAKPEGSKVTSGVTLADGRVFLGDNAFYQPGYLAGFIYNTTDLSGVIVHEFFHRAGLSEAQVTALHSDIQRNCGIPGFAL